MTEKRANTKVSMSKKAAAKKEDEEIIYPILEEKDEQVVLSVDEEVDDEDFEISPEEAIIRVEELDSDEPIFKDGPTAGEVVEWKEKHGDVYLTAIDYDNYIIWRRINRAEYRDHVKNMSQLTADGRMSEIEATLFNEEAIYQTCTLFPDTDVSVTAKGMAGLPALITQQVMEASGFMALDVRQL